MKEINVKKAAEMTSPNPLVLVCTQKPDGRMNLAPVSFVSYLSFNPPMLGFAMGKKAYTGQCIRNTGKAVIAVPGETMREIVIACGTSSGSNTDKINKYGIDILCIPGSNIEYPAAVKLAFIVSLAQVVEVGNHDLFICNIEKIFGDETQEALFAWGGYARITPAREV